MIIFIFLVKICKRLTNAVFGESDRSEARANIAACVLVFAVALIVFGSIINQCGAWRTRWTEQQIDRLDAQISNADVSAGAANQAKRDANAAAAGAETAVNQARENLNRARNANYSGITGKQLDDLGRNYK